MNGLDPRTVRAALPSRQGHVQGAVEQTAAFLHAHGGYVSYSGGADSTAVVDLARQADPHVPVVWFDSGLEFPENRAYIHRFAEEWALNLHIIKADPDALTLMAATGAWDHNKPLDTTVPGLHDTVITRPALEARQRFGKAELWGMRAHESQARRMLLTPGKGRFTRKDGTETFSPVWAWTQDDVAAYLYARGVPENPVYARLRALGARGSDLRVGLMWDANSLGAGRAVWLRQGWPTEWARIVAALPRAAEWA